MEPRLMIAYALIALLIVSAIGWTAYALHNTRDRQIARQRAREALRMEQA